MTPAGDTISHSYAIVVIDSEGKESFKITIDITMSQAMGVGGNIEDLARAHAVLDNAKDAVAGFHLRKTGMQVPGKDVSIPGLDVRELKIDGPIEYREYTLAVLDQAKVIVSNHHSKKLIVSPSEGLSKAAL